MNMFEAWEEVLKTMRRIIIANEGFDVVECFDDHEIRISQWSPSMFETW